MNLLFILENYLPHIGGVEIVFKNLCEGLAKKHDVTVVTHKIKGTKEKEVINGVRVLRIPSLGSRYIFTLTAIPTALKQAKRSDVIHTTTYNGAFPAWIASKIRRKPAVITVHESWLGHWKEYSDFSLPGIWLHEFLEWLLYSMTSFRKYICVSDSTRKMLSRTIKKEVITIHNGFDPTMWKQDHSKEAAEIRKDLALTDKFVVFAAGRPGTSKGFQYLIDAFPFVKKRIPNAVLLLVLSDDKQYRHRIKAFKRRAHEDIYFVKPQPYKALPAFRQMADCVVHPSLSEGFGFAILETAATGTPLVATNTTSIPEVIWGKHVLVKPKSSKALADGIVSVYEKKYKNTKEKSFPWKETIKEYEKIYEAIR